MSFTDHHIYDCECFTFKFQLDRKSLEIIYTSFIRPLLEYSNAVWDNCTQYESNDLEKIQSEAAPIVTGATKLTSLQSIYIETGWESLASRRLKSKLVLFYKMQNEIYCDMFSYQYIVPFQTCIAIYLHIRFIVTALLNTSHLLHLRLSVVQQDIDYAMNQTFKLFLLNHNNAITLFCPQ